MRLPLRSPKKKTNTRVFVSLHRHIAAAYIYRLVRKKLYMKAKMHQIDVIQLPGTLELVGAPTAEPYIWVSRFLVIFDKG